MNMPSSGAGEGPEPLTTGYSWYVAWVLALAALVAYLNRQVIVLVVEPIKADLHLTDFQVSLLVGPAYVFFYATMSLPMGYLADRVSRRHLMTIGVVLWTLAAAVCGVARSFTQFLVGRLGVGFGQSTLLPASYSLLPDYFSRTTLPRAFGIVQMGSFAGGGLSFVGGGLALSILSARGPIDLPFFGVLAPWQSLFLLAAAPGIILAFLTFSIREPESRAKQIAKVPAADAPGFAAMLSERKWFFIGQMGSAATLGLVTYAVASWTASFFIRTFGWTPAQIGVTYGTLQLVFGVGGTYAGGYLGEIWTRKGVPGAPVRVYLWSVALLVPCAISYPLCSNETAALVVLAALCVFIGGSAAVLPAILQLGTPTEYRGRISSFYLFLLTVFGIGGGPVAVAAVTDFVFQDTQRLNHSISVVAAIIGPISFAFGLLCYRQFVKINPPQIAA